MPDATIQILRDLRRRRDEIRPLVDELQQIESAIEALERIEQSAAGQRGRRRTQRSGGSQRGRPRKGQATRSDEFLALVQQRPGVTVRDAAKELGVHPNSLYRVSSTLQREGAIHREGQGFVPGVASQREDGQAEVVEPPGQGATTPES